MDHWTERRVVLKYRFALRTAGRLTHVAQRFKCDLEFRTGGLSAPVREVLTMLVIASINGRIHPKIPDSAPTLLGGDEIVLAARGPDAEAALDALLPAFDHRYEPA